MPQYKLLVHGSHVHLKKWWRTRPWDFLRALKPLIFVLKMPPQTRGHDGYFIGASDPVPLLPLFEKILPDQPVDAGIVIRRPINLFHQPWFIKIRFILSRLKRSACAPYFAARARNIKDRTLRLVRQFEGKLPKESYEEIVSLIVHGELEIALENLCSELYEWEVEVSSEQLSMIQTLAKKMKLPPRRYDFLSSK